MVPYPVQVEPVRPKKLFSANLAIHNALARVCLLVAPHAAHERERRATVAAAIRSLLQHVRVHVRENVCAALELFVAEGAGQHSLHLVC